MSSPGPDSGAAVGFVGLGKMGTPMVTRLCAGGFKVHAYDVLPEASAAVRDLKSCTVETSLQALARAVDVIITMLPNGGIVRAVVLGEARGGGVVEELGRGGLIIDMSSSHPQDTRQLGGALADRGVELIDAPVSGGVARAIDGTLSIFVGGNRSAISRARSLLDAMGSNIFVAGDLGAGHTAKALNNLLSAACFAATVEVVEIAAAAGLDRRTFAEIIDASTGRNNTTQNKLRQFVLSESYDSGFAIGLMAKDLAIARDVAGVAELPVPLSRHVVQRWTEAADLLGADADHTAFAKLVRHLADEEPPESQMEY